MKTHCPRICARLLALPLLLALNLPALADYSGHPEARALIDELVAEEGFERAALEALFAQTSHQQAIIDAMTRPAEKTKSWGEYREIFLQPARIEGGAAFWEANQAVLSQVEAEFGVPPEIVVAIIGVETLYGRITGSYRVLDALSTLAFDYPPRAPFFRGELRAFLQLTREYDRDPLDFKGSYAGAMGLGQFMPSSYLAYARNFDDDPFADIWNTPADAIWSVANYLNAHGWRAGEAIAGRASAVAGFSRDAIDTALEPRQTVNDIRAAGIVSDLEAGPDAPATVMALQGRDGTEYWIGLQNFYVITRYNHSHLYAMAVYQLAQEIAAARRSGV